MRSLQSRVLREEWEKRAELEQLQKEQQELLELEKLKRMEFEMKQQDNEKQLEGTLRPRTFRRVSGTKIPRFQIKKWYYTSRLAS